MNYQMITTDDALASSCEAVHALPTITLDIESVRTRIYYPQLGLIQLFDGGHLALTDSLGTIDQSPLKAILRGPFITKFLHTGSKDLEVFLSVFGKLPQPLIGTQILAAFCERPISQSFAPMVEGYSGATLNRSELHADWLTRPLIERQCEYVVADVWCLLPITAKPMVETKASGWLPAVLDECRLIQMRCQEAVASRDVWYDIANAWQLRTRQLICLQPLADWRLCKARKCDLAVNLIVREEHLWSVACYMPGSPGELDNLDLSGGGICFHSKTLLALVEGVQALSGEALPQPMFNLMDVLGYRKAFKAIKSLTTNVSKTHKISTELLASRRQINRSLNWHWELKPQNNSPELISGWRGELMAEALHSLLQEHPQ